MNTLWNNEQFKFILKFSEIDDELDDLILSTDYNVSPTAFVNEQPGFSFESSQASVNRLFSLSDSLLNLKVTDTEALLNKNNTTSPYFGHLVPGIKLEAYIADDLAAGETYVDYDWQSYGTWFVTSIENSVSLGDNTTVKISAKDIISEIGALKTDTLQYSGSTGQQALVTVLTAAGLTNADYVIDSSLDLSFAYTKLKDTLATTINDILRASCGYCTILHNGKLLFASVFNIHALGQIYTLDAGTVGDISLPMHESMNYGRVEVKYASGSDSKYFKAIGDYASKISTGSTTINVEMPTGLLSIEALRIVIKGCADGDLINDVSYVLSGNILAITVSATLEANRDILVDIYASVPSSAAMNTETYNIDAAASNNSYAYVYETTHITSQQEAETLAEQLGDVIRMMRTQLICSTSMLSPYINVGDTITITNSDIADYNGDYMITSLDIDTGASYNTSFTLLKYSEEV